MAHDVFISYSSKDKPTADAACALLESLGVRCWIAPRDVAPGSDWSEAIIDAIAGSRVMVLIFSDNANRSPQVRREVERAVHREVTLVPFRIENVPPSKSLEYFISVPHWMDAWNGPLETYLGRLADRVMAILRPPAEPAPLPAGRPRLDAGIAAAPGRPRGAAPARPVGRGGTPKALRGLAFAGVSACALAVGFTAFGGRLPWPPTSPAAAAASESKPVPSPGPVPPPTRAATPPAVSAAAPDAKAAQAPAGSVELLPQLSSVAVIGQQRLCVIDSTPLREGDAFRDFVVQEIQTDRVVLTRDGSPLTLRLQPRAANAVGAADAPPAFPAGRGEEPGPPGGGGRWGPAEGGQGPPPEPQGPMFPPPGGGPREGPPRGPRGAGR